MKLEPVFHPDTSKPMPKAIRVDLRTIFLIGIGLWIIALVITFTLHRTIGISMIHPQICVAGVIQGVLMLIWEYFDRTNYRLLGM